MNPFDDALAFTLRRDIEGGWYDGSGSHDPNPTMKGVTQRTYDAWRAMHGKPRESVRYITDSEVHAIAFQNYWLPAKCTLLPPDAAIAQFDCAYNMGPKSAIRVLQSALGVATDGVLGPITLGAITRHREGLADEMLWARLHRYHDIVSGNPARHRPSLPHWLYRVMELRDFLARLPDPYPFAEAP